MTLVKMINHYTCDVVIKDLKGFRSYRVSLERNSRFENFYRITDVKGKARFLVSVEVESYDLLYI